jgi:hypothetical protein
MAYAGRATHRPRQFGEKDAWALRVALRRRAADQAQALEFSNRTPDLDGRNRRTDPARGLEGEGGAVGAAVGLAAVVIMVKSRKCDERCLPFAGTGVQLGALIGSAIDGSINKTLYASPFVSRFSIAPASGKDNLVPTPRARRSRGRIVARDTRARGWPLTRQTPAWPLRHQVSADLMRSRQRRAFP